jgi:hypothetical protein
MATTVFNPTQLYLLQLFSFSTTEDSKRELQDVLTNYYSKKVSQRANELWDKMEMNQQKLDTICNIHERLPY